MPNAHTPLTSITASNTLGGSPNQLQIVLDQHQSDFLDGIPAVEQLRQFVASASSNLTPAAVQTLVNSANGLITALGNVNMALQLMIMAIDNVNGGISYSCATGLVPGQPFPVFNQHSFAMEGNGNGGSAGPAEDDVRQHLEEQGVDPDTALNIALFAEEQGLSLAEIQKMFDALIQGGGDAELTAQNMQELINNGSMSRWFEGAPGRNLSDVTDLLNNSFSTDAVTTLLNNGADLKSTLANAQALMNNGVDISDINQWTQQGLNLKYAKAMMGKGISANQITNNIGNYSSADPGIDRWQKLPKASKRNAAAALQRWESGARLNQQDGSTFGNKPVTVNRNGHPVKLYPFPGNNSGPYTEYDVGTTHDRIVVDKNGQAYYFTSNHGHYHPDDAIPIPYSFIAKTLGG